MIHPLVSSDWLSANLERTDLFIFDVSMAKVVATKPIVYEHLVTIPHSYKVSIENDLSDVNSSKIHAFPSAEQVQQLSAQLGFNSQSTLILYDDQGIYSAPRAWWIFISLGYEKVFILDGGLPQWLAQELPVDDKHCEASPSINSLNTALLCNSTAITTSEMLLSNIKSENSIVIDVRAQERFLGIVAEPRAGVRSGHIPKSRNLPFSLVLASAQYKPADDLKALFKALDCHENSSLIFSCGSGITACIVLVAAIIAGITNVSLYDGSWSEWGTDESLPIEK